MARNGKVSDSDENTPLLPKKDEDEWQPPRGFFWIETAMWANVFLSGFDGTITASTYALISSDFNAANSASWLTTSYLITSTAFQPLYGRFSDIFGRRCCFFVSTTCFMLGCLGCSGSTHILSLIAMRSMTGIGGGGLITMATIVNSDMIPFKKRGMYQAAQNVLVGFGAVCGASFGGMIADSIGWRWCFLMQVPVSLMALGVGFFVLQNPKKDPLGFGKRKSIRDILGSIDITGSVVLLFALMFQLVGISLGGNELPWSSKWVIGALVLSTLFLVLFVVVEISTSAVPIIPMRMLRGTLPVSVQITNIFVGMAAYAFLFMLPLFFQVVLEDTPSKAGARLIIPSLATPIGGIIAGYTMSRGGRLCYLVRIGTLIMTIGNFLVVLFHFHDAAWKYLVFLIPANLGLGMTNPSVLFSFVAAFEHKEQAVATSLVYLIRSLGTIYGVTITSSIVQNVLLTRLPEALSGIPDKEKIIDEIRHSVFALRGLPPSVRLPARMVYYDAIKLAFIASTTFAGLAVIFSLVAGGQVLERRESKIKAAEIPKIACAACSEVLSTEYCDSCL